MRMLMLTIILVALATFAQGSGSGQPPDHSHHTVKHYFVLMGENEVFASHVVYRPPHNYQVLMKVQLPAEIETKYLESKKQFPKATFLLYFNPFVVSEIQSYPVLKGVLLQQNPDGQETLIAENLSLDAKDYQIFYFEEVPF